MKTVPKAQPPRTKCHQKGVAKNGLVSEPMALSPSSHHDGADATPAMMRQEPTPVEDQDDRTDEAGQGRGLAHRTRG